MITQEFLTGLYGYLGGQENVASCQIKGNSLHLSLKDQGKADLEALRSAEGVVSATLSRGRLRIVTHGPDDMEEYDPMADNKQLSIGVLEAVGGKENVSFVTHCMTRLRFNLKDQQKADLDKVRSTPGVLGCQVVGDQVQVIIGPTVTKVYEALCDIGGFEKKEAIDENLDAPKEKLTPKKIGSNILKYLSGSMVALIPLLCGAGLLKAITVMLGPTLFNVISAESDTYLLLDFIYNAAFYFLPLYVGYTAAKQLGATPLLGMYLGGILVAPQLVTLATDGATFAPFGIEMPVANYGQSVLPILLGVFVMYWLEKFFKKVIPDVLAIVFVPFCTVTLSALIMLYLLAPLGNVLGSYVSVFLQFAEEYTGFVGVAVVAALWTFLVMTGMHQAILPSMMVAFLSTGSDACVMVGSGLAGFGAYGMALGATIAAKTPSERSANFGMFLSGILGGIGEPAMFGVGMRYMRPFIAMVIANLVAGVYAGLMGVEVLSMSAGNFLRFLMFAGGSTYNLIHGSIALLIALFGSAALTVIIGLEPKNKPAQAKKEG